MTKRIKILAGLIIGFSAILAVSSSWDDSLVEDEIAHISAGYSYLVKHDMRLNPEHPPLVKYLSAIPLLFLDIRQDAFKTDSWQTEVNGQWNFGLNFLFRSGNNPDRIKHYARMSVLLFFIFSALLVFKWAYELYGYQGGIISLVLFSFSPTVMAHSRLVTTDMAAVFGVLSATYFYLRYLKNQSQSDLWRAGVVLGLALLMKFSTLLLLPFFIFLALFKAFGTKKWSVMAWRYLGDTLKIFAIGAVFVVWPFYYLNMYNYEPARQKRDAELTFYFHKQENFISGLTVWASDKAVLRPFAEYALGALRVSRQIQGEPHKIYFLGEMKPYSRIYFPVVYFLKEPLAWWILFLSGLLYLLWQVKKQESWNNLSNFIKNHFQEFAMILWLFMYWGASIGSTLNIGLRHILPVYPFTIILISSQITKIIQNPRPKILNFKSSFYVFYSALLILLGWYLFENIRTYPYYLTYFNQVAGGPSGGYRYVVDSNLDWGQDLIRFKDWVSENKISKIELGYFGGSDPAYYLGDKAILVDWNKYKNAEDFKANNKSDGWIAVSVSYLQNSAGAEKNYPLIRYSWLYPHRPVAVIGNSIFVYHIKE